MPGRCAVLVLIAVTAAPALAEPQVYRLSDADRAAAIASASHRPEAVSAALLPDPERDRILGSSLYADGAPRDNRPHGEVSMFVGTGGAYGIGGSIGAPLGDASFAQFSFHYSRLPTFIPAPYRWQQQRR